MAEPNPIPPFKRAENGQVREALDRLEGLVVDGLKHGRFNPLALTARHKRSTLPQPKRTAKFSSKTRRMKVTAFWPPLRHDQRLVSDLENPRALRATCPT
jgi:hypothetical protein